ncbi:MAG: MFS transporter, partial [Thermoplasmata archaeon]|nr:MFS transporter [Thermoplasmata archaeon]
IAAVGAAVGPILGGVLTTYASWRWGFGIEAFICLIILGTSFFLTETKSVMKLKQLDVVGAVVSGLSMLLMILALLNIQTYGLINPRVPFIVNGTEVAPLGISIVFWVLLTGIILFVLFIWLQKRRLAHGKIPLLNTNVFKNWGFNTGLIQGVVQNLALAGILFIFPIYLGSIHDYEAVEIGIFMMPMSIAVMVLSLAGTKLSDYIRPIWVIAGGLVLMIVGNNIVKAALSDISDPWDMVPGLVVFGCGGGLFLSQLTNSTMAAVKKELVPDASGMLNTTRQLGTSMGTALLGGVLMLSAFYGVVDGLADEPEFEDYTNEEIAIILLDFLDKYSSGATGDLNLTDEEAKRLAGLTRLLEDYQDKLEDDVGEEFNATGEKVDRFIAIVDNSTADAMAQSLTVMNYTLFLGLVLLFIGAALYVRQLKKDKESILKGEINWDDVAVGPEELDSSPAPGDQEGDEAPEDLAGGQDTEDDGTRSSEQEGDSEEEGS